MKDKKIVMISQPMNGKTHEEILTVRDGAVEWLEDHNYKVIDTIFDFNHGKLEDIGYKNIGLYFLAESLKSMSRCDAVYFCKGWENTRGCCVEHEAAVKYGLKLIYQEIEDRL